ncbi:MAG: hypothetical protein AAF449_23000, partial [Myxococcota bacterium]
LPPGFLLSGRAWAADPVRKFAIIAQSGAGEAINGFGPGSFESPAFIHPSVRDSDHVVDVAGRRYTADALSETTTFIDGPNPVRIAQCFEALGPMQDHLVFFNYRTSLGIHPQFPVAQRAGGKIRGPDGRGSEELASAIAQENAVSLGTLLAKPIVLSGSATYRGAPLSPYSPTVIKELVSSSVERQVPSKMFSAARNRLIDRIYRNVKSSGTPNQKRFLDEYAISQQQADQVASKLFEEVVDIADDGYTSQMKMAAIIIKLRLAPVVVVGYRTSGDNHVVDGLSVEAVHSLNMMATYRNFYDFANEMGVWDRCLYGTVSVFGRTMDERGNGRGHNGNLCSGLLFGGHLGRKVVGGIDSEMPRGVCLPFNAATGGLGNPNVSVQDSQACYAKSVLKAVGVPQERLEERVRDVPAVTLS